MLEHKNLFKTHQVNLINNIQSNNDSIDLNCSSQNAVIVTKNFIEEKDRLITKLNYKIIDLEVRLKEMESRNKNMNSVINNNNNIINFNSPPKQYKSKSSIKGKKLIMNNKQLFNNVDKAVIKEKLGKRLNFDSFKNSGLKMDFFKPLNAINPMNTSKSTHKIKHYLYYPYKQTKTHSKKNSCMVSSVNNSFSNNKQIILSQNNSSIQREFTIYHTQKNSPRYMNKTDFQINEANNFKTPNIIVEQSADPTSLDLIDQLQCLKYKTKGVLSKLSQTNQKLLEKLKNNSIFIK